jgi:hypothetical protein
MTACLLRIHTGTPEILILNFNRVRAGRKYDWPSDKAYFGFRFFEIRPYRGKHLIVTSHRFHIHKLDIPVFKPYLQAEIWQNLDSSMA